MWRLQPKLLLKNLYFFNNPTDNFWGFFLVSTFIHTIIFLPIFLYKQTGLIIIDSGNLPVYYNFSGNSIGTGIKSFLTTPNSLKGESPTAARPECSSKPWRRRMYRMGAAKKVKEILDNSIISHDTNSFIKLGKKNNKASLKSKKFKTKNIKNLKKNKTEKINLSSQKIKSLKEAFKKLELHEAEKNNNLKQELKDTQKSENNLNNKDLIKQADILSEQINIGADISGNTGQEFPLNGYLMTDMNLVNDIRSAVGKNWSKPKGFSDVACEFKILVSGDGQSVTILEQKNSKVPAFNIQAKGAILNTKFPEKCWGKELNLILR